MREQQQLREALLRSIHFRERWTDKRQNPPLTIEIEYLYDQTRIRVASSVLDSNDGSRIPYDWKSYDGEKSWGQVYPDIRSPKETRGRVERIFDSPETPTPMRSQSHFLKAIGFAIPSVAGTLGTLLRADNATVLDTIESRGVKGKLIELPVKPVFKEGVPHLLTIFADDDSQIRGWYLNPKRAKGGGTFALEDGETYSNQHILKMLEFKHESLPRGILLPTRCGVDSRPVEIEIVALNQRYSKKDFQPKSQSGIE